MCGQHVSSRAVLLRKAVLAAKGQVGSARDTLDQGLANFMKRATRARLSASHSALLAQKQPQLALK